MRARSAVTIGRDSELRQLLALVDRAHAGETRSVLVHGEAGVGKTRLVSDLVASMREQGVVVFLGHGVHLAEGELPFGVLSESLRDLTRAVGADRVREILGPDVVHLAPLVPALRTDARSDVERARVIGATTDLVEALSVDRTVCWLVEDLQWTDTATADAFTYLTRFLSSARLLLVATWRDEDTGPARPRDVAESIEVRTLRGTDLDELVAEVAPDFDVRHRARVAELSDGLPFLVEELVDSWDAARGVDPAYLRRLVLTRLPELSPPARELLELAAVGEGHLDVRLVCDGLDVERTSIREVVDAGLLVGDGGMLRFRHALLREAIADVITQDGRRWHHRRWAEAIEADEVVLSHHERISALATHWDHALVAEKALPALAEVARAAHRLPAPQVEHHALRRILRWWDRVPEAPALTGLTRERLLVETVKLGMLTNDFDHTAAVLEDEQVRARATDDPVGAAWAEARATVFDDNFRTTLPDRAVLAVVLGADPGDPRLFDAVDLVAGHRLPQELEARIVELLQRWRDHGTDPVQRRAAVLALARIHRRSGAFDETVAELRSHRDLWRGTDLMEAWPLAWTEAWFRIVLGQAATAVDLIEEQLARLSRPGTLSQAYQLMAENLAHAYIAVGRWDEAVELATSALAVVPELEECEPVLLPSDALRCHVSTVRTARGDLGGARVASRPVEGHAGPTPWADREPHAELLAQLAAVAAAEGDLTRCRATLAGAWHLEPEPVFSEELPRAVLTALRAESTLVDRSDLAAVAESAGVVDQVMSIAVQLTRPGPRGAAWWAEALAHRAHSRGRDSCADWAAAVAGWRECGQPYDVALTLRHLGEAQLTSGDAAAATETLTEAHDLAVGLGARPSPTRWSRWPSGHA